MVYDWYQLFNLTEFVATGLVQRTLVLNLESRGIQTFLLSSGNVVSISYDDGFLPVGFLGRNPYTQGQYAVYKDLDNNVWFGFLNES